MTEEICERQGELFFYTMSLTSSAKAEVLPNNLGSGKRVANRKGKQPIAAEKGMFDLLYQAPPLQLCRGQDPDAL